MPVPVATNAPQHTYGSTCCAQHQELARWASCAVHGVSSQVSAGKIPSAITRPGVGGDALVGRKGFIEICAHDVKRVIEAKASGWPPTRRDQLRILTACVQRYRSPKCGHLYERLYTWGMQDQAPR